MWFRGCVCWYIKAYLHMHTRCPPLFLLGTSHNHESKAPVHAKKPAFVALIVHTLGNDSLCTYSLQAARVNVLSFDACFRSPNLLHLGYYCSIWSTSSLSIMHCETFLNVTFLLETNFDLEQSMKHFFVRICFESFLSFRRFFAQTVSSESPWVGPVTCKHILIYVRG